MLPSFFFALATPLVGANGNTLPRQIVPPRGVAQRALIQAPSGVTFLLADNPNSIRENAGDVFTFVAATDETRVLVLAPGQSLWIARTNVAEFSVSVHYADIEDILSGSNELTPARFHRYAVAPAALPVTIAAAPNDAPLRVLVRNNVGPAPVFLGGPLFLSTEFNDVVAANAPFAYRMEPLMSSVFYLAPGQTLYANTTGASSRSVPVEESRGTLYGDIYYVP